MSLKSSGRLSATLSGTGMRAASAASSPYLMRLPVGACSTSPLCARQDAGSTFQRFAAAATSMVLAVAPAWRSGCHAARIAFELPVACTPPARDCRRAFRWAEHAPAAPASGPPPALRRSASGSRYRCPGPSRHRAWSGRSARRRSMRMKALGTKPSASAASASPFANGRLQAQHQASARGRAGLQEGAPGETARDRDRSDWRLGK